MTKITAIFSNGHTDTYNGKRAVKAAWMVVLPNGQIISGHSYDRVTAEKTARSNATLRCHLGDRGVVTRTSNSIWAHKVAREAGFPSLNALLADNTRLRNEFVAQCRFEVVDL